MGNDLRYDDYFLGPIKKGFPAYGTTYGTPLVRDTYYTIGPVYKEYLIYEVKATTSAVLTGASLKVVLRRGGAVAITAAYADQSVATAITDQALTPGTMFTANFKLNRFTFGDVVANTPAVAAVLPDFNVLDLAFQITGADVPANYNVTFEYTLIGRA